MVVLLLVLNCCPNRFLLLCVYFADLPLYCSCDDFWGVVLLLRCLCLLFLDVE